jgi:Flp pilus assembly protein TadG
MAMSKPRGIPCSVEGKTLCRPRQVNRRGVAAVEFALVAPIFFLTVMAMFDFGRAIMVQQVVTNAARAGARQAVLDGATASSVRSSVNSSLAAAGLSSATTTINPTDPSTAGYGQTVAVTVMLNYSQVSWLRTTWFITGTSQLSSTATMRREAVE